MFSNEVGLYGAMSLQTVKLLLLLRVGFTLHGASGTFGIFAAFFLLPNVGEDQKQGFPSKRCSPGTVPFSYMINAALLLLSLQEQFILQRFSNA